MKKKLVALLCSAAVVLSLLVVPASAAGLFFLSLNDTLMPQTAQTTPIQYGSWTYVPVTVFNSRVTGVNFGIYYSFADNNESLNFYDLSGRSMTFDLVSGTASAVGGEAPVPNKVIWQNGVCYVPAYALCRYFGLGYSYHTTDYGPLLRIKNSGASLSDGDFINSAMTTMRARYINHFGLSPTPATPTPENPPATEDPEEPETPEEEVPTFSLTLGLRASGGRDLTAALNALSNVRASAVVFFPADTLTETKDQIRQAAGRGHKVGLIPAGETAAERLESTRQGSELLAQILRRETWFVLASDQELSEAGYICWVPGLTPNTGSGTTRLYNAIVDFGERRDGGRVLLDTRTSGSVLTGVLQRLSQDGDTFLQPRETRY